MRHYIIIILLLLSFSEVVHAQEIITTRDMGSRVGLELDYSFSKNYEFSVLQEVRFSNNATKMEKMLTDVGLSYRIDPNFSIGSNLRYAYNRENSNFVTNDFRYNFDFKFKGKIARRTKIKYRLRYQQGQENFFTLDRDNRCKAESNFRNKITITHSKQDHKLFASSELFRKYELYQTPYFNKLRINVGDEFDYKKDELKLSLGYEQNLGRTYPFGFYFIEITYLFKRKK